MTQTLTELKRQYDKDVQSHGPDHPIVGLRLLELGDACEASESFNEAANYYKQAADIFADLGVDHELLQAIALRSAAEMAVLKNDKVTASSLKAKARSLIRSCFSRDFGLNGSDNGL